MQLLNLALAGAGVYLLLRYGPFGRWINGALAFGYFPAYEYGTISRSYGLGVLAIVAFCVLFSRQDSRRYLWLAAVLGGLALTSAYGVIAAVALAAGTVTDAWLRPTAHRRPSWQVGVVLAAVLVATVVAAAQMRQPVDAGFIIEPRPIDANAALRTSGSFVNGLLPIPPPRLAFWNRHALDGFPIVKAGVGLVLLLVGLVALRRHRVGLVIFTVHAGGLFLFTYLIYSGGVRHHGHFFLLFLAGSWIALSARACGEGRVLRALVASLAVVHLAAGTVASAIDISLPFSGSKAAAAHITAHYAADMPIVADPELPGVSIAALTGRAVYFPQSHRWGTFVVWNDRRARPGLAAAVAAADRVSRELDRDLLLVLSYRDAPPARFERVGHFPSRIVDNESYDVYLLKRGR